MKKSQRNSENKSSSDNPLRWLLRNPDPVPLRSSDPKFLEAVERRSGLRLWDLEEGLLSP